MAKISFLGANIDPKNDTFGSLIDKTNRVIYEMGTSIVTAAPVPFANSTNGAMTTGNVHIDGILTSNEFATKILRGGSMANVDDLTIGSSTVPNQSSNIDFGKINNRFNALFFKNGNITTLENIDFNSNNITTKNINVSNKGIIEDLTSITGNIKDLQGETGYIKVFKTDSFTTTDFSSVNATIDSLTGKTANIDDIKIKNGIEADTIKTDTINATNASITTASIDDITGKTINVDEISSKNITVYERALIKDLEIVGETKLSSTIEFSVNTSVANLMTVKEFFKVRGNTEIGNTLENTIKINASLDSNLIPKKDITYNIGDSNLRFKNIFVQNIFSEKAEISNVKSNTITSDNLTINEKIDTKTINSENGQFSGNLTVKGNLIFNDDISYVISNLKTKNLDVFNKGFIKNLVIGNNVQDTLFINSALISDVLPQKEKTYNLGSGQLRFKNVFSENVNSLKGSINDLSIDTLTANLSVKAPAGVFNSISVTGTATFNGETTVNKLTGKEISGKISGDGSTLKKINADNISDGTVSDDRLPKTLTGKEFSSQIKIGNTTIGVDGNIYLPFLGSNLSDVLMRKQDYLGFTPVQNGTGIGQSTGNIVKIGWDGSNTRVTIDSTDMGSVYTENYVNNNRENIRNTLGLGNLATKNVTTSWNDPSGGNEGDIWLKLQ